jgi:hypothetical protein
MERSGFAAFEKKISGAALRFAFTVVRIGLAFDVDQQ